MNFIESELAKYQRRLKKLEDNPDPSRLSSNKLLYQLWYNERLEDLRAWEAGKPFAYTYVMDEILEVMGFRCINLSLLADRVGKEAPRYLEIARAAGYPDNICDRLQVALGMVISGDLPPPNIMVSANTPCDVEMVKMLAAASYKKCPLFIVDRYIEPDYEPMEYVAHELQEMIRFAEREVPGVKWNEEKFAEDEEKRKAAQTYMRDIYDLCKSVPCPVRGSDVVRIPEWLFATRPGGLEYFKAWRDEVVQRAQSGIGVIADEELRVMWAVGTAPSANLFPMLEKRGVSVPVFMFDVLERLYGFGQGVIGDETEYGRKLTPLEEFARRTCLDSWQGPAEKWVKDVIRHCRDFSLDAVLYFMPSGCPTNLNSARIVADRVEEELGLPTLMIEGPQLDIQRHDDKAFIENIENFLDVCLARKKAR